MFRNRSVPLAFVALLALSPMVSGESREATEGHVYEFAAGENAAWSVRGGSFLLMMAAGTEGVTVDLREMHTGGGEGVETIGANNVFVARVDLAEEDSARMEVMEGMARVLLGRVDLQEGLPVGRPPDHLEARDEIASGECRAYRYDTTFMREPTLVRGEGQSITFSALETDLELREGAEGMLSVLLDPDQDIGIVMQACHRGDASASLPFVVETFYPAPSGEQAAGPRATPGGEVWLLGLAVAVGARRVRFKGTNA